MKKKQQKQIKAFLIEEFGKDRGSVLFDEQEKVLNTIIKNTKNKSKNHAAGVPESQTLQPYGKHRRPRRPIYR